MRLMCSLVGNTIYYLYAAQLEYDNIYIAFEVITGFDFNEREEKRFRRTRSSRVRGKDLLRDSYTDTQHRVRGGCSHGGISIYAHA